MGEKEQMASHGMNKTQLKRGRSPIEAWWVAYESPRKLSKLESSVSTVASNWQTSPLVSSEKNLPKPSSPSTIDTNTAISTAINTATSTATSTATNTTTNIATNIATNNAPNTPNGKENVSPCIDYFQSPLSSLSPASTLQSTSITDDTSFKQRTKFIEAHNAPEELSAFPHFARLSFSSAIYLELKISTKMRRSELAACFDLISNTSQEHYKVSTRGWDPGYKVEEMTQHDMMYLLVRQAEGYIGVDKTTGPPPNAGSPGDILGFLSFKFEREDEEYKMMRPVAYIYEIHLDDRLRGQGLGARMIKWVEDQSRLVRISKVMLTVFTANEGAKKMYEREGFARDPLTPADRVTRRRVIKTDYVIMSKEI
jgi:ribosomal protein S18 acetylase RimI-like enzyme